METQKLEVPNSGSQQRNTSTQLKRKMLNY